MPPSYPAYKPRVTVSPQQIMMMRMQGQGQQPQQPQVSDDMIKQIIEQYTQSQGGASMGGGSGGIFGGAGGGAIGSQIGGAGTTGVAEGGGMSIGTGGGMSMAGSSGAAPAASAAPGMINPYVAAAIAAAAYGNNLYEGGVKDIARGRGKSEDYANLALDVNPVTAPINMIGRTLGMKSVGRSLFGAGKTTKQTQKENWGKIAKNGDAQTKAYADQYSKYIGSDQAKKDAAKGDFGERAKAGTITAEDTWGAQGLFDLFGNDYLGKTTEDQRRALNDKMIKENLFSQEKGDLKVTNKDRAKVLWDETLGGNTMQVPSRNTGPAPLPKQGIKDTMYLVGRDGPSPDLNAIAPDLMQTKPAVQNISMPSRSQTSSPGFTKDGKKINFSARK